MFTDGYIFICNDLTEKECFSNCLFGAPRCCWRQVSKICATTAIFLLKKCKNLSPIMYGVFLPHGRPELNIDQSAWKGKFPSQVRVRQYYKFSASPMITFKTLFDKNKVSSSTGLRITLSETLYLVTKFIINTRFHLSHLVKRILGELGVESPSGRVDEKLHIRFSMFWLKKLACDDQLKCLFLPEFMLPGGTIDDFINAIRITGGGEDEREIILYLKEDWQNFKKLVTKLGKSLAVQTPEISSILSQQSLLIWPSKSCDTTTKKWLRRPSQVPSSKQASMSSTAQKMMFQRSNCRSYRNLCPQVMWKECFWRFQNWF